MQVRFISDGTYKNSIKVSCCTIFIVVKDSNFPNKKSHGSFEMELTSDLHLLI